MLIKIKNIRGQVVILVTIGMIVLLLIIGIAIDGGIGVAVKAKLASAVDAAAIAAGNAIKEGGDETTRRENATAAAIKFYYANFTSGSLRAIPSPPDINIQKVIDPDDGYWHGEWTIEVTGQATVPTFFLRIAGNKTFTASAIAETLRRDLDMSLVIDDTESLAPVGNDVKNAAKTFVDFFGTGADRIALITFGDGAEVNEPIWLVNRGFDKTAIISDINSLSFDGFTNFGEGLWQGKNQLDSIAPANRSSLRVMVFFTDGSPNTFSSIFRRTDGTPILGSIRTGKTATEPNGLRRHDRIESPTWYCCYNLNNGNMQPVPQYYNAHGTDEYQLWPSRRNVHNGNVNYPNINRISRNLSEDMAEHARSEGIIVYTLGLEGSGRHMTGPSGPDGERGIDILKRMANTPDSDTYNPSQPSGLFVLAQNSSDLENAFKEIAAHILRLTK